jgi:exonuclease III
MRVSIINVYAPHSGLTGNSDQDNQQKNFYKDLKATVDSLKNGTTMIIIAGDLNSELGYKQEN